MNSVSFTVLFPEGGGQPSDTGSLVPLDASGSPIEAESAIVREVARRNLDAVHFVTKAFPVGSQVLARVDMERRTDLMSMHTAQHLLSAVLERDYELDTLSWSLQKFPEPCYIELPRVPTPEEIEKVQARCNEVIREKRSVKVRMELVSEETGVTLNEKAPDDYRDGERAPVQRTVIIDGIDDNPFVFLSPASSLSILTGRKFDTVAVERIIPTSRGFDHSTSARTPPPFEVRTAGSTLSPDLESWSSSRPLIKSRELQHLKPAVTLQTWLTVSTGWSPPSPNSRERRNG